MLTNLWHGPTLQWLVKTSESDLGVVVRWILSSRHDIHPVPVLAHDLGYVERHRPLNILSERARPHCPRLRKPASSTLHAHPKFRQSALIDRELSCSKSARIVGFVNPGGVIADN